MVKFLAARRRNQTARQVKLIVPDLWALIGPRRWLLVIGLTLIVLNRASGLVLPGSVKVLVDNIVIRHQSHFLLPLLFIVLAATLIQAGSSFALTQLLSKEAHKIVAELRQKVQEHVVRLQIAYFDSHKTGVLVSRIINDVEGVRNLIGTGLMDFLGALLTASIALLVLLRISMSMTVVAVVCLVLFSIPLVQLFRAAKSNFRDRRKLVAELAGRLTESISGIRIVKGYGVEDNEAMVLRTGVHNLLTNALRLLNATSLMSFSSSMLVGIVGTVVMYMGVRQITTGSLTLGGFVTYTLFLGYLVAPMSQIVSIGSQIMEAIAGLERTHEVLAECLEHSDPVQTVVPRLGEGEVRFERVSFAYQAGQLALTDVSFVAKGGSLTALVGPSGAGKSTIISLIAGFYKPCEGQVLIDYTDLNRFRLDLYRKFLGIVLQEPFLFDGTIRDNVMFSRPGATDTEVRVACQAAHVDELADLFTNGYDTIVGERGVRLSGGQKQRISIARAILAAPRILLLDEATSSLDAESEMLIQQGLSHLTANCTTFVIAHRLSTIRRADQIVVLEKGRVMEHGTHQGLYAARQRYYDLYNHQYGPDASHFVPADSANATTTQPVTAMGRTADHSVPLR
jgi:ABC-type multidrug transport system fused ATPase/permease subunit